MTTQLCVIGGGGHVGLPLSIAFADKGLPVTIYDLDNGVLDKIRSGIMPFIEKGADAMLKRVLENGKLSVSNDPSVIVDADVIISIVGTPVNEHLNPKFDLMPSVFGAFLPYMRDGQLLVLRSTVFPGTSENMQRWLLENNKKVDVAFCPERIAEGKAMEELFSLPQIVSAFNDHALKRVKELFLHLTDKVIEVTPTEAELAKLFTNSWRYIKFAASNQFFMIANNFGVDFDHIYKAMTTDYPRAQDFPKPGFAAGPCLFKDTMQLSASASNTFFLGHSAMLVNEGLPNYVVDRMRRRFTLRDLKVGILGMAFKADIDDKRDSLSYKLRDLLSVEVKELYVSDPYIQSPKMISTEDLIAQADVIVVATPHSQYRSLDYKGKIVVDIWNLQGEGLLI